MNVGQPIIAAAATIGETGVVDAEQMQDGGVEVVDLAEVGGQTRADFLGFAVDDAASQNMYRSKCYPLSGHASQPISGFLGDIVTARAFTAN